MHDQQPAQPSVDRQLDAARAALATTTFDPTLRQVLAELFAKEHAAIVTDQALCAAASELGRLGAELLRRDRRIAELERRLDALDEPARVRSVASKMLEWETVDPPETSGRHARSSTADGG